MFRLYPHIYRVSFSHKSIIFQLNIEIYIHNQGMLRLVVVVYHTNATKNWHFYYILKFTFEKYHTVETLSRFCYSYNKKSLVNLGNNLFSFLLSVEYFVGSSHRIIIKILLFIDSSEFLYRWIFLHNENGWNKKRYKKIWTVFLSSNFV